MGIDPQVLENASEWECAQSWFYLQWARTHKFDDPMLTEGKRFPKMQSTY